MENVNLGIYSVFMSLFALGVALYIYKSNRNYLVGSRTAILFCITMGVQWFYTAMFFFYTQSFNGISFGLIVGQLLIPDLSIIPVVTLGIAGIVQRLKKND